MGICIGILVGLLMIVGLFKTFPVDKDGFFRGGLQIMKEELKQQLVKTLKFLKKKRDINKLTLNQIRDTLAIQQELLRNLVEKVLDDEDSENGTTTAWWLYENVDKKLYEEVNEIQLTYDVSSAEDFVTYMIER